MVRNRAGRGLFRAPRALKHSSFPYYARATDILGHETVTDSVTVTVR